MRLYSYFSIINFSNSYLLGPDGPGDAVLIDAGIFDTGLLSLIEEHGFYLRHVLLTHGHRAHVNGISTLLKVYDATVHCHDPEQLSFPAQAVRESRSLKVAGFEFRVLETPGHSSDSVCYLSEQLLFTGDTLSAGRIGETDTAFERALLLTSIRKKILSLGQDVFIFPGHGPPTRLEVERLLNPALAQAP
ncbi:MAG: MBL fold metallo-hydrolase [Spirochaetales bacterium]|nr:MBL fold metallo-hydrolase [Spirochaetales bacterium]